MDARLLNEAIVLSITESNVPGVSQDKIVDAYGAVDGPVVFDAVMKVVREAASQQIDWSDKSLVEGVNEIMSRFSALHPELTREALFQIGRCVGWLWR
jgi:hypothetical protein